MTLLLVRLDGGYMKHLTNVLESVVGGATMTVQGYPRFAQGVPIGEWRS